MSFNAIRELLLNKILAKISESTIVQYPFFIFNFNAAKCDIKSPTAAILLARSFFIADSLRELLWCRCSNLPDFTLFQEVCTAHSKITGLIIMCESFKFPNSRTFETPILKPAVYPLNIHNLKFKLSIAFLTD